MTRGFKLYERHYGAPLSRGRGAELSRVVSMISDDAIVSLSVPMPHETDPYTFSDDERDYVIKTLNQRKRS